MSKLQETLLKIIAERGISQTELSKISGVPQPVISRILSGESKEPRHASLAPLAQALGVDIGQLREAENLRTVNPAIYGLATRGAQTTPLILRELERNLPDDLKQYVGAHDRVDGLHYKLHYLSPKIAADLVSLSLGIGALDIHGIYRTMVLRAWRLSSHQRLRPSDRKYFLFVQQQEPSPEQSRMLNQITIEAAKHGITLISADPTQAAHYIADLEAQTNELFDWEDDT